MAILLLIFISIIWSFVAVMIKTTSVAASFKGWENFAAFETPMDMDRRNSKIQQLLT